MNDSTYFRGSLGLRLGGGVKDANASPDGWIPFVVFLNRSHGLPVVGNADAQPGDEGSPVKMGLRRDRDGIIGKAVNDGDDDFLDPGQRHARIDGYRSRVLQDVAVEVDRPRLRSMEYIDDFLAE